MPENETSGTYRADNQNKLFEFAIQLRMLLMPTTINCWEHNCVDCEVATMTSDN